MNFHLFLVVNKQEKEKNDEVLVMVWMMVIFGVVDESKCFRAVFGWWVKSYGILVSLVCECVFGSVKCAGI